MTEIQKICMLGSARILRKVLWVYEQNDWLMIKEIIIKKFRGSTSTKWFFIYLIRGRIGIWKCWLVEKSGKPEYPEKNLSEQRREPTTNSTHVWHWHQDLKMGDTDGRQAFSALHHPAPPSLPLHFAYMFENLKKYMSIAQTWESFRKYPSVGKVTLSLLSITTVCWKKCKQMIVVVVVVLSKWLVQNIEQDKCNSLRISKWLVQSYS